MQFFESEKNSCYSFASEIVCDTLTCEFLRKDAEPFNQIKQLTLNRINKYQQVVLIQGSSQYSYQQEEI